MFDPTTGYLALGATHAHVLSARPDAPVVAYLPRGSRPERVRTVRSGVAARLHSIAQWVEPAPRRTCQPG